MTIAKLKRLIIGAVLAVFAAAILANFPLCALYTPDDPEWYVFFCYLK